MRPKGILVDYGGTLVEEVSFNARLGNEELLIPVTSGRFTAAAPRAVRQG